MGSIAFAVSLPEHVERFDPVRRHLPGAEFLLLPGRWPAAGWDSRQATLNALASHGAPPVITRPDAALEQLVFHGECAPERLAPFLAGSGRLTVWRDGLGPARRPPEVTALAPAAAWLRGAPGVVTGDPRLDDAERPAVAARARHRLGLPAPADRPLILVIHARPLSAAWAQPLVQLRTGADLVFHPAGMARTVARPWPRCVTGPGVVRATAQPYAELLAGADLVVGDHPAVLWDATSVGRAVLGFCEGSFRAPDLTTEAAAADLPWEGDPSRLTRAIEAGLAGELPRPSDPRFSPRRPDAGAARAIAAELLSYQSTSAGVR